MARQTIKVLIVRNWDVRRTNRRTNRSVHTQSEDLLRTVFMIRPLGVVPPRPSLYVNIYDPIKSTSNEFRAKE